MESRTGVLQFYLGSILFGVFLKFAPYLLLIGIGVIVHFLKNQPLPDNIFIGGNAPHPDIAKYIIVSVLAAPLFENLLLPLTAWFRSKLGKSWIIPVVSLSAIVFLLHGSGLTALLACLVFIGMYFQFEYIRKRLDGFHSYMCTVVTHSTANIATYAYIIAV